jgi:prepilin-type N-terminal cleavage/methylation domain-containing protein
MKKFQSQHQKGFTLIETLVAVAILVVAVTGAYGAATEGIASGTFSKDQTIAFYLAQEGIEQIRNMRDDNGLASQPWLTGIAASSQDACYFGSVCTVDAFNNAISRCPSGAGSCPLVQEDPVNGFYGYSSGWTNTIYDREISLISINPHEVAINVVVKWSKGGVNSNFTARENIFDWQ